MPQGMGPLWVCGGHKIRNYYKIRYFPFAMFWESASAEGWLKLYADFQLDGWLGSLTLRDVQGSTV